LKTRKCAFVALVATLGLFMPAVATADPVNFAALEGQTVQLTVEPYSSGENNGQYYVGLTEGIIDGQTFWMFCDDSQHDITVPTTYSVVVEGLTAGTFTGDNMGLSLAQLQEQSILGLNFGTAPSGNLQKDIAAQQAIWNISTPGMYPSDATMTAMTNIALGTYGNGNYSDSYFLNPTDGGQGMMPVDPTPVNPTPEPSSLLMLGTGLLGLAGAFRGKFRHSGLS